MCCMELGEGSSAGEDEGGVFSALFRKDVSETLQLENQDGSNLACFGFGWMAWYFFLEKTTLYGLTHKPLHE